MTTITEVLAGTQPAPVFEHVHDAPTVLNRWNGRPTELLFRTDDGQGLLVWRVCGYGPGEVEAYLWVALTEEEVDAVRDSLRDEGLLEPVRAELQHPEGWLYVPGDRHRRDRVTRYRVPREGSEEQFLDGVEQAVDRVISPTARTTGSWSPQAGGAGHDFLRLLHEAELDAAHVRDSLT